jgi:hypothetical protein
VISCLSSSHSENHHEGPGGQFARVEPHRLRQTMNCVVSSTWQLFLGSRAYRQFSREFYFHRIDPLSSSQRGYPNMSKLDLLSFRRAIWSHTERDSLYDNRTITSRTGCLEMQSFYKTMYSIRFTFAKKPIDFPGSHVNRNPRHSLDGINHELTAKFMTKLVLSSL